MARWQQWPVIDGAYADDARPWSCQDTCNWLPAPAEQAGTRSTIMLRTPPGLLEFCDLGTDAPLRGTHDVEGLLLAVSGTTLFSVSPDGTATSLGTIPGVGRVSMDHTPRGSGFHVGIANGQSGYIYDTAAGTLTQITDEGFPGASIFQFIDGYLAFLEPFGRFWGHSELNDGLSYNTLDRYTAESAPDGIVSLIVSHREVFVLGTRSGEFFRNTGAATGTFQRADGYEMERGICSTHAIARSDNTVKWVGDDGATYRLEGHQPVRVSNGPVEQAFAVSNLANAFAFAWDDRSHNVFYVTLPDGQTWGHDAWTQRWHRRQSYGLNRWRLATLTKWNGQWIGGDYTNGKLYTLSWDDAAVHENGEPLVSERTFPVAHDVGNDLIINGIRLLFDSGRVGTTKPIIAGSLADLRVGETLVGRYTASGGLPGYTFAVIAGTFPPGAELGPDGVPVNPVTTPGTYTFTVQVTDSLGRTDTLVDTVQVAALVWWLTTTNGSSDHVARIWESDDNLASWPLTGLRTPNNCGSPGFGAIMVDAGVALVCGNTTSLDRITDFDSTGGYTTAAVPLTVTTNAASLIRPFGEIVVVVLRSPAGTTKYFTSNDSGLSFTERTSPNTGPGSTGLVDVARITLPSGLYRWVATLDDNASGRLIYSDDQGEPVTWVNASQAGIASGAKAAVIVCNGTAAATVSSTGAARTTDGLTWTAVTAPVGSLGVSAYDSLALGDLFLASENGGAAYFRSTDAGQTWARITGQPQFQRYQAINGRIVASIGQAALGVAGKYSDDLGLTWTALPVYPYSVANGDSVRIVRMEYFA